MAANGSAEAGIRKVAPANRAGPVANPSRRTSRQGLETSSSHCQPLGTSLIEVTLSPNYQLIQKVTIYVPSNATDPYFDVAFSQFNAVLGNRFHELDGALDITVVLDSDEDVCRIGYGVAEFALQLQ